MTRLLFQGVDGVSDQSEQMRAVLGRGNRSDVARLVPSPLVPQSLRSIADDDALHEECGVVAIHGHPDAARQAYLALYALQHRGQESAGIATADGQHLANIKGMGLVSEIFTDDVLAKLPGPMAIGHTRYSTTGDSALLNAQPIRVDSTKGLIAIAHNGNLVNLGNLRMQPRARRRLFPNHFRLRNHRPAHRTLPGLHARRLPSPTRCRSSKAHSPSS